MKKMLPTLLRQMPHDSVLGVQAAQALSAIEERRVATWNVSGNLMSAQHYRDIYEFRYLMMREAGRNPPGLQETLAKLAEEPGMVFLVTLQVASGYFVIFVNELKDEVIGCFYLPFIEQSKT